MVKVGLLSCLGIQWSSILRSSLIWSVHDHTELPFYAHSQRLIDSRAA